MICHWRQEQRPLRWPGSAPLPTAGQHVVIEPGWGGFVEYVSWDFPAGVLRVYLR